MRLTALTKNYPSRKTLNPDFILAIQAEKSREINNYLAFVLSWQLEIILRAWATADGNVILQHNRSLVSPFRCQPLLGVLFSKHLS